MTQNHNDTKKLLMLNNIDPMFNIRSAFFFQPGAVNIFCQVERFGIFDMDFENLRGSFIFGKLPGKITLNGCKPWSSGYGRILMFQRL